MAAPSQAAPSFVAQNQSITSPENRESEFYDTDDDPEYVPCDDKHRLKVGV